MYDRTYWQAAEYAADHPDQAPETHMCEFDGCEHEGLFKAPKSPSELRSYRWFCQPHIQEYNKAWNYFAGLNASQMEHVRREDVVGWRPTWPLGTLRGQLPDMDVNALRKHIFRRFFSGKVEDNVAAAKNRAVKLLPEEQQALTRLGLNWPTSLYEVKTRYRELVKKHHPDAQGPEGANKSAADETIKLINRAYAVLKRKLATKA